MRIFRVIMVFAIVALLSQSMLIDARAGENMNVKSAQKLIDAFNRKDIDAYIDVYATDVVYHGSGRNGDMTRSNIKEFFKTVFQAFPDGKLKVEHLFGNDDLVVYQLMFTGKQTGDWAAMGDSPGIMATNKMVKCRSIGFQKYKDGKIVEEWENFDDLALLKQLGVMQPPPPDPNKMTN